MDSEHGQLSDTQPDAQPEDQIEAQREPPASRPSSRQRVKRKVSQTIDKAIEKFGEVKYKIDEIFGDIKGKTSPNTKQPMSKNTFFVSRFHEEDWGSYDCCESEAGPCPLPEIPPVPPIPDIYKSQRSLDLGTSTAETTPRSYPSTIKAAESDPVTCPSSMSTERFPDLPESKAAGLDVALKKENIPHVPAGTALSTAKTSELDSDKESPCASTNSVQKLEKSLGPEKMPGEEGFRFPGKRGSTHGLNDAQQEFMAAQHRRNEAAGAQHIKSPLAMRDPRLLRKSGTC